MPRPAEQRSEQLVLHVGEIERAAIERRLAAAVLSDSGPRRITSGAVETGPHPEQAQPREELLGGGVAGCFPRVTVVNATRERAPVE